MVGRPPFDIALTPDLEKFIADRIASGRFRDATSVVREGLRLLGEQEAAQGDPDARLRGKLAAAVEQADRGDFLDGDAVFDELRRISAERRGQQQQQQQTTL